MAKPPVDQPPGNRLQHGLAPPLDLLGSGPLLARASAGRIGCVRSSALPDNPAAPVPPGALSEEHRAFGSHLIRSGPWSLPHRSSWRSIFGTIDLDLREARLAGPETVPEVYNLFGTVTVIVPDGVEVVVRGGGLFARPDACPYAGRGLSTVAPRTR